MKKFKNIVALGDSITKGVVYTASSNTQDSGMMTEGHYSILDNGFVSQCADYLGLPIANYGKMGCTVTHGSEILEQHRDVIAKSDITLIEYGGNDSDFSWYDIAESPDENHYPTTELPFFRQIYRDMISRVRDLGSMPVLLTLPLIDYRRFFAFVTRNMGDQARANVLSWLGGQEERIRNYHDMYSLAVYEVGMQERVPVIDITSPFLRNTDYTRYLCIDGIHPSQEGHDLIAHQVVKALSQMV